MTEVMATETEGQDTMHGCEHCGCGPAPEVLRRDVNVGQGGAWLVRYRDKHFVISTGREGDTLVFRASPTGEVTDWDNVAPPVYGTDKQQALDALTARPVDGTGRVLSPRDELDEAEAADERRAQTSRKLNKIMDFDHPVRIGEDGSVSDGLEGVYAPELVMETDDGQILDQHEQAYIDAARSQGWELLTGWTGQYSYHGPVMHSSEYVGGALADHISETPGTYVVITVETDDGEGAGWAVARKIETDTQPVTASPAGRVNDGAEGDWLRRPVDAAPTADDIITRVTQAPDETAALAALDGVPRSMLMTLADQLYIDAQGRSSAVVRRAIAKEARA